jgi:hypothetical protein
MLAFLGSQNFPLHIGSDVFPLGTVPLPPQPWQPFTLPRRSRYGWPRRSRSPRRSQSSQRSTFLRLNPHPLGGCLSRLTNQTLPSGTELPVSYVYEGSPTQASRKEYCQERHGEYTVIRRSSQQPRGRGKVATPRSSAAVLGRSGSSQELAGHQHRRRQGPSGS